MSSFKLVFLGNFHNKFKSSNLMKQTQGNNQSEVMIAKLHYLDHADHFIKKKDFKQAKILLEELCKQDKQVSILMTPWLKSVTHRLERE